MVFDILLILCSFVVFISGIVFFFAKTNTRSLSRRLLVLNAALLLSIFLLELFFRRHGQEPFRFALVIINSMKALRMSADYAVVTSPLSVFDGEIYNTLLRLFRTTVYTVAPITGFTLIYDVIAGFSPTLKLFFLRRRTMFVFSQLSRNSLHLAEDISAHAKQFGKPVVVFTVVEKNSSAKLLSGAKAIGAICLEDGILHCDGFKASKHCCFFLMDDTEGEKLSLLHGLMSTKPRLWDKSRGCGVFFFTDSADTVESVRAMKRDYKAREGEKESEKLKIHIVRSHAQTCAMLLDKHPLFNVLKGTAAGEALNVMMLGFNSFSQEMAKSIFWCGQILDHPLHICFVSTPGKSEENQFKHWLDSINPEIVDSCTPKAKCLRYSKKEHYAQPYAELSFITADVQSIDVHELMGNEPNCFFIMDDDDGLNISLAENLRRELTYRSLNGEHGNKLIYTLIQDENLNKASTLRYSELNSKNSVIKQFAFGSLSECYSWKNISMDSAYLSTDTGGKNIDPHSLPAMDESKDDIYNEWSTAARRIHLSYKMFSAGCSCETEDKYSAKQTYANAVRQDPELFIRLTWLEHRRWNSFLRMEGFRTPSGQLDKLLSMSYEELIKLPDNTLRMYTYKNISDRLHPCLVESCPWNEQDSSDFLDMVSDLREYVDDRSKKPKAQSKTEIKDEQFVPYGLKKYDAPDWEP